MECRGTTFLSMNEFRDALVSAKPGETVIYATGDIAYSGPHNPELVGLKSMAWAGHLGRDLYLTQRRTGTPFIDRPSFQGGCEFEYRATKSMVRA